MMASLTASPRLAPGRASPRTQAKARSMRPMRASRLVCRADPSEVIDDVRKIIADQLGTEVDKAYDLFFSFRMERMERVAPEAKFVDLGADSLDTVEIMMALEEKFGTAMEEEKAQSIATVQDAANLIAEQMK